MALIYKGRHKLLLEATNVAIIMNPEDSWPNCMYFDRSGAKEDQLEQDHHWLVVVCNCWYC